MKNVRIQRKRKVLKDRMEMKLENYYEYLRNKNDLLFKNKAYFLANKL